MKHDIDAMIQLKLKGLSYREIAKQAGVSRQRIHQLLSPPSAIGLAVQQRAQLKCEHCQIRLLGGHIHHKGGQDGTWNDLSQLEYLCLSCHRIAHQMNKIA